jgi:hypothetical protein
MGAVGNYEVIETQFSYSLNLSSANEVVTIPVGKVPLGFGWKCNKVEVIARGWPSGPSEWTFQLRWASSAITPPAPVSGSFYLFVAEFGGDC